MHEFLIYDNKNMEMDIIKNNCKNGFLKFAYSYIQCDLVEYASLTPTIDIITDEEAMLKSPIDINYIYDMNTERVLFLSGKLLFAGFEEGHTKGLNQEQIKYIKQNIKVDTIPISIYKALL